jgi:DUF4097 and DUF4098 domain-containing protein YvlB
MERNFAMPEFDRSTPVTVSLRTQRGTVDIAAEERATITVDVRPLDNSDTSREGAANTRVALDGDTLVVHAPEGSAWQLRRSPKLAITIRVPAGSSIQGKSASADIRATGRYAAAELDLASADVNVEEVTGDAHLSAASGDLTVGWVGGGLLLNSSSGDLEVGDVSIETASGDITIRSVGGSLRAGTASGDIEIGRVSRGQTQIKTASGDVKVGVAAGTGVWLDLNTASGDTKSDLTMEGSAPAEGRAALELHVRTASGDIHISRARDVPAVA